MDGPIVGWVGGIIGTMGGIIGTVISIESTEGPIERAFVKRSAVIVWIAVSVFLGLLLTLPKPYNHLLWIPYVILGLIFVPKMRKEHTRIRRSESGDEDFISHL